MGDSGIYCFLLFCYFNFSLTTCQIDGYLTANQLDGQTVQCEMYGNEGQAAWCVCTQQNWVKAVKFV